MFFLPPGTMAVYNDCDENESLSENNITSDTFMGSPQLEITECEVQSKTALDCGTIGFDTCHHLDACHRESSHEAHSSC
jgi:hypothetical protein